MKFHNQRANGVATDGMVVAVLKGLFSEKVPESILSQDTMRLEMELSLSMVGS